MTDIIKTIQANPETLANALKSASDLIMGGTPADVKRTTGITVTEDFLEQLQQAMIDTNQNNEEAPIFLQSRMELFVTALLQE